MFSTIPGTWDVECESRYLAACLRFGVDPEGDGARKYAYEVHSDAERAIAKYRPYLDSASAAFRDRVDEILLTQLLLTQP